MYDDNVNHRIDGLVYSDGSICHLYHAQNNNTRLIHKMDIHLIGKFKNGGQSQNRLARIRDENRDSYVSKVVENIIKIFYDKNENKSNIVNLVLFGPSRFKNDIMNYKKNTLSKYFDYIHLLTTSDIDLKLAIKYTNSLIDPTEQITIDKIQKLIDLADDKLTFGNDIHVMMAEHMICKIIISENILDDFTDNLDYDQDIMVLRSDGAQDWIIRYGGVIGLKWY